MSLVTKSSSLGDRDKKPSPCVLLMLTQLTVLPEDPAERGRGLDRREDNKSGCLVRGSVLGFLDILQDTHKRTNKESLQPRITSTFSERVKFIRCQRARTASLQAIKKKPGSASSAGGSLLPPSDPGS